MNVHAALAPFPILTTPRLRLRMIQKDDQGSLFKLFNDPLVTVYNTVDTIHRIEDVMPIFNWIMDRYTTRSGIRWAITLRDSDNSLIGTAGFNDFAAQNHCGEIGYDLMPPYWGRGLMTEAVRALVKFGFESVGLNRIEADVTVGNVGSSRVLQKTGFILEGVLRQRGYWKGRYHDLEFWSLLRDDYYLAR